jgi:hypothetical protein
MFSARSSIPVATAEQRRTALDILLKEKDVRLAEAAAHAEWLQAGVVFYLTVIVAGRAAAARRNASAHPAIPLPSLHHCQK